MNRMQMAQRLFIDPNLRAKNNLGNVVKTKRIIEFEEERLDIVWEKEEDCTLKLSINFNEKWEIIESNLKEFTFEEVLKYWRKNNVPIFAINNSKGKNLYKNTLNWYDMCEKWTIEGVYEDDE
jgi:hypothetical protein